MFKFQLLRENYFFDAIQKQFLLSKATKTIMTKTFSFCLDFFLFSVAFCLLQTISLILLPHENSFYLKVNSTCRFGCFKCFKSFFKDAAERNFLREMHTFVCGVLHFFGFKKGVGGLSTSKCC